VLFASSGGAGYGEQEEFPAPETHRLQPVSPYGVSKIASELYLGCFRALHGIEWAAMRYANVYGPRQDPHGEAGVVAIFAQKVLRGETPTIHGDGHQTRDYVYVGDVVRANLALAEHSFNGPLNFGTGIETDVCRLFELIAAACGSSVRAGHGPAKPGEQRRSVISPALAKRKPARWEPA
jgi:UDP-glucose 4-epimerase